VTALVVALGAVFAVRALRPGAHAASDQPPAVGALAPDLTFTTVSGQRLSVADLRGHPALLWFVTTWCSSCQAGTQVMAQDVGRLAADGVRVVELELYGDLGGPGPDIATFGRQNAGPAFADPDWIWGSASRRMSLAYDPAGYLDIYYLLDTHGRIRYVNSSPAATMPDLLAAAARWGLPATR